MNYKDEKTPDLSDSPHIGGHKMSSSLKERLKRSSRSFTSPVARSADSSIRVKLDTSSDVKECPEFQSIESPAVIPPFTLEDIAACNDQELLQKMYFTLKRQTCINEDKLRKLELVEQYNLKNKPDDLVHLIQKWLTASQESLRKLYEKLPENKSDFSSLLRMLNIDNDFIHYDPDGDTFY